MLLHDVRTDHMYAPRYSVGEHLFAHIINTTFGLILCRSSRVKFSIMYHFFIFVNSCDFGDMFLFFSVHSYCRSSSFKRFTFLKIVRMKCLYLFWHEASIHLLRFAGFSYLLLFGRAWMFLPPEHLESSEQKE